MTVEPCPPGSGASDTGGGPGRESEVRWLVAELESRVGELAQAMRASERDWYLARFADFYDGGIEAFGRAGPDAGARLAAELWFLLDCPLDSGEMPLHRIRSGRASELLARSELRAWRVASVERDAVVGALCPLGTGRARLEMARPPLGELRPGAMLVARCVSVGPGRWAALGRGSVVDPFALADFDALLASLDAPRGEFWRVHGGVLARAAATWPEDREVTLAGEAVEASVAVLPLVDPSAAMAALESDPELHDGGGESGIARWDWIWHPPRGRAVLLRRERGVRYGLCGEDAAERPVLARIVVDLEVPEACLLAPTPARLDLAVRLLAERLGPAIGGVDMREVDPPSVVPRWKRAAFERERRGLGVGRRAPRAA